MLGNKSNLLLRGLMNAYQFCVFIEIHTALQLLKGFFFFQACKAISDFSNLGQLSKRLILSGISGL